MIITDFTQTPAVNKSVNLTEIAALSNGKTACCQILAVGDITSGEVKLSVSQDNISFFPLTDAGGEEIKLLPGAPVYLKFAN
ncbi:MAG: hypothetical protein LBR90_02770, partial [Elusimicrobiota bacterium]|nr:hypothetical protein [Elusimicrobiota bacterium]